MNISDGLVFNCSCIFLYRADFVLGTSSLLHNSLQRKKTFAYHWKKNSCDHCSFGRFAA